MRLVGDRQNSGLDTKKRGSKTLLTSLSRALLKELLIHLRARILHLPQLRLKRHQILCLRFLNPRQPVQIGLFL